MIIIHCYYRMWVAGLVLLISTCDYHTLLLQNVGSWPGNGHILTCDYYTLLLQNVGSWPCNAHIDL